MNLQSIVEQYATFRKTLGERFGTNGRLLKAFCRAMGQELDVADVSAEKVSAFLAGKGPLTASWHVKHNALLGFYRYAISRGFVTTSPLPLVIPKRPEYRIRRASSGHSKETGAPFFVGRNGQRVNICTLENAFQQIRVHAGLRRDGGVRCQPRLHDLRHTSAVHRLTTWYREGKDVQTLLPQLSVYMGHTYLAATQVYLTMTPELLHEASMRFERYATPEGSND